LTRRVRRRPRRRAEAVASLLTVVTDDRCVEDDVAVPTVDPPCPPPPAPPPPGGGPPLHWLAVMPLIRLSSHVTDTSREGRALSDWRTTLRFSLRLSRSARPASSYSPRRMWYSPTRSSAAASCDLACWNAAWCRRSAVSRVW
jgi:hypothetical protein